MMVPLSGKVALVTSGGRDLRPKSTFIQIRR